MGRDTLDPGRVPGRGKSGGHGPGDILTGGKRKGRGSFRGLRTDDCAQWTCRSPLEHGGLRPKALERGGRLGPKCSRTPGLYVVEGKVTCWLGEARWPWERLPGQWTKGASECCAGTLTASGGGIPLEHGTFAHGVPARRPPRWGEVLDPGRPRGRGRSGGHVVGDMLACGRAKGASECCARTVAASGSGVPPRAPELRP